MTLKSYIPSVNNVIKIAITMGIVFFVLNYIAPESIKKYFRV